MHTEEETATDIMVLVNTSTVMVSLFQSTHASKYSFIESILNARVHFGDWNVICWVKSMTLSQHVMTKQPMAPEEEQHIVLAQAQRTQGCNRANWIIEDLDGLKRQCKKNVIHG